jgi:hypothetical protein
LVRRKGDQLARRHCGFDGVEETDELLVPLPLPLHAATDATAQHVQRREQRRSDAPARCVAPN